MPKQKANCKERKAFTENAEASLNEEPLAQTERSNPEEAQLRHRAGMRGQLVAFCDLV